MDVDLFCGLLLKGSSYGASGCNSNVVSLDYLAV